MKKNVTSFFLQEKSTRKNFHNSLKSQTHTLLLICSFIFYMFVMVLPSYSQNNNITLDVKETQISEILNKIEGQTKYKFLYTNSLIDLSSKTSINVSNKSITDVLNQLFSNTKISYRIQDSQVILAPKTETNTATNSKQTITVTGKVTDKDGLPIPMVNVLVKGAKNVGVMTHDDGTYSIAIAPDITDPVLQYTFIGLEPKEEVVGTRTLINVTLEEAVSSLEEVVVVGYGTVKKVNLTGAVSQISSKDLEDRPVSNVTQMLQGAVPGLNVTMSGGSPDQGGALNVRGTTSINGGAPLVLVDGIPGDLNTISPNDIESVSVLKDASASAIYGARGAFGVVLVTTKSARGGKTSISYSNNFGWSSPTVKTDFLTTGYDHVMLNDEAFKRSTGNTYTRYSEEDYEELRIRRNDKSEHPDRPWVVVKPYNGKDIYNYYGNYDWWHTIFQDVQPSQQHSISVQGSNDKISYLLSGSYYQKEGIMKVNTDKFRRFNFRSKISANLNKWLKISNNTSYYDSQYRFYGEKGGGRNNFIYATVHALPAYAPINPDGSATYNTRKNNYSIGDGRFADLLGGISGGANNTHAFTTSTELEAKLGDMFRLTGNFSYSASIPDNWYRRAVAYYSIEPGVLQVVPDKNIDEYEKVMAYDPMIVSNLFLNYEKSFGKHNTGGVIGVNYENQKHHQLTGRRKDLLSTELNDLNLATGAVPETGGGAYEYTLFGVFARLNYDYAGKYLLEFSGRYDGTSRFGSGNRYGFFPSVSGGWRISEEPFFAPIKPVLSDLKVRASYGSLGNQLAANKNSSSFYPYLPLMTSAQSNWLINGEKTQYVTMPAAVSPDLTWEKSETLNFGIDLQLFKKLNASVDIYNRKTIGMLTKGATLPGVFGADAPSMNSANLSTKGFEIQLTWRDHFNLAGKTFSYSVGAVLSDYTTEVTKYKNNPNRIIETRVNYMGSYLDDSQFFTSPYKGQDVGEIWGFTVDGYFKSDAEAQSYGVDQSYVNRVRQNSSGEWTQLKAGDLKFVDLGGTKDVIDIGEGTVENPGDLRVIGNRTPRYSYGLNLGANWNGIDVSIFLQGVMKRDWYPGNNTDKFWGPYSRPYFSFLPEDFVSDVWTPENPNAYFPILRGYDALNSGGQLYYPNNKYLQKVGYLRVKNITIGYSLPEKIINKIFMSKCRVYVSGENLLTFTKLRSDYIDPEQPIGDPNARVYPLSRTLSFGIDITF